jgi:uncharacterized protein (TIGR02611 family)
MNSAPDVGRRADGSAPAPVPVSSQPSDSDDTRADEDRTDDSRADPYGDPRVLLDSDEDRWAWRARIKGKPTTRRIYRVVVGVVGVAIVLLGIVLLPAPGPGWAIIFVGLAVLASEFEKAQRLLDFAKRHVHSWTKWMSRQHLVVRVLVGLAILAFVLAIFWAYFALMGVPAWLPDVAEQPLLQFVPGLR